MFIKFKIISKRSLRSENFEVIILIAIKVFLCKLEYNRNVFHYCHVATIYFLFKSNLIIKPPHRKIVMIYISLTVCNMFHLNRAH